MMTQDEARRNAQMHRQDQSTINGLVHRMKRAEGQRDDLILAIERALGSMFGAIPNTNHAKRILEDALGDLGRR